MKNVKAARILHKISETTNEIPTVPSNDDHTTGWNSTDIYEGEFMMNEQDIRLFTRLKQIIVEVPMLDPSTNQIKMSNLPSAILGAVRYEGTWDASSGSLPLSATTIDNKGYYYIVNISGTTSVSGRTGVITDWRLGDWIIYDGEYWDKVDASDFTSNNITYANDAFPAIHSVQDALDKLLYFNPTASISVTALDSLNNSKTTFELGETAYNPTITWSVNKTMTTIKVSGAYYTTTELTPNKNSVIHVTTTTPHITNTSTYSIAVNDGTNSASASATLYFWLRCYWGVSSSSSLNDAGINGLSNSILTTGKVSSVTVSPNNQYWYYCYPAAWGTAKFVIGGIENVPLLVTQLHINASGYSASYNVYRSVNLLNSSMTISIS
jgi:hypothetical protein